MDIARATRYNFENLSWRRLLSYRNQSIDMQSKSVNWFLYDNGLRHERVKNLLTFEFTNILFILTIDNYLRPGKDKWKVQKDISTFQAKTFY